MISLKGIKYLGHVVSEKGVSTDPDKIKAVTKWPQSTTVTEVRSFWDLLVTIEGLYQTF